MTQNPFLPAGPKNSFNRVRIVDLPGLDPDPDVRGASAYDLVSAPALVALIRDRAAALDLPPDGDDLPRRFDRRFEADDPGQRAAAEEVGRVFGRRLGYVLLALKRGDAVNRAARLEWDARHWAWWGRVRHVWLGGGLAAGHLGERTARHASAVLAENGFADCVVSRSPYGRALPLFGAARYLPPQEAALVFDFGHTAVKRAAVDYQEGQIAALTRLRDVPADFADLDQFEVGSHGDELAAAQHVRDRMVTIMAEAWREVEAMGVRPGPAMAGSVACYLHDGHPVPEARGRYSTLRLLSDHAPGDLAARLGARLARQVRVTLVHDATAAASVYAGAADTVVLVLGTAVGVGFPPPPDGLCPLVFHPEIHGQGA